MKNTNPRLIRPLRIEQLESRKLLAADVANLGHDASNIDVEGDWLAYSVSEFRQGSRDLNGDGDTNDQVLHLHSTTTGAAINVSLAISGSAEIEDNRVTFLVSESRQGDTDLNGDGDTSDTVLHVYNTLTNQVSNLGLHSSTSAASWQAGGRLLAFLVNERNQGEVDLNGDGDAFDRVLHVHNMDTGIIDNLGLAVTSFELDGTRVAIVVREASQANSDLNGDGDAQDFVLHDYDAATNTLTNLALDVFGSATGANRGYDLAGERLAFRVSEARQGGTDRNGDGDTSDNVLHLVDLTSMMTTNLGFAVQDFILDDHRLAFEVVESRQGGVDLNGDGDATDSVAYVYDSIAATTRNLQLATNPNLGFRDLTFVGDLLAVGVAESRHGGADLNGDGDTRDIVPHVVDTAGGAVNLGVAAGGLTATGNRLAFEVRESSQGATDLNGDGDAVDTVLWIYDAQDGGSSALPFAVDDFQLGEDHAIFTVRESSQGGVDLNGDGDMTDDVLHAHDLVLTETTNFAIHADDFELAGARIGFLVSERRQANTDLNNDGDASDRVLHLVDLPPADPIVLVNQMKLKGASLDLYAGIRTSLQVKLDGAIRSLQHDNTTRQRSAIGALQAWRHEVSAQRGKAILAKDADELLADALVIIGLIEEQLLD